MKQERQRLARRLFDAMGEIEDRYIAEAETVYVPNKRNRILPRLLSIGLCLTVFVGAYVAFMMSNMAQKGDNMAEMDADEAPSVEDAGAAEGGLVGGTTATSRGSLNGLLLRIRDRADLFCAEEALPSLTDGTPRLIWKYANEETYRMAELTPERALALTDEIKAKSGTALTAPDSVTVRLWIVTSDGTVITPYLPYEEANLHHGELFPYEPKIEPSAEFVEQIEQILTQNS